MFRLTDGFSHIQSACWMNIMDTEPHDYSPSFYLLVDSPGTMLIDEHTHINESLVILMTNCSGCWLLYKTQIRFTPMVRMKQNTE